MKGSPSHPLPRRLLGGVRPRRRSGDRDRQLVWRAHHGPPRAEPDGAAHSWRAGGRAAHAPVPDEEAYQQLEERVRALFRGRQATFAWTCRSRLACPPPSSSTARQVAAWISSRWARTAPAGSRASCSARSPRRSCARPPVRCSPSLRARMPCRGCRSSSCCARWTSRRRPLSGCSSPSRWPGRSDARLTLLHVITWPWQEPPGPALETLAAGDGVQPRRVSPPLRAGRVGAAGRARARGRARVVHAVYSGAARQAPRRDPAACGRGVGRPHRHRRQRPEHASTCTCSARPPTGGPERRLPGAHGARVVAGSHGRTRARRH